MYEVEKSSAFHKDVTMFGQPAEENALDKLIIPSPLTSLPDPDSQALRITRLVFGSDMSEISEAYIL